jgi:hypothetical protein
VQRAHRFPTLPEIDDYRRDVKLSFAARKRPMFQRFGSGLGIRSVQAGDCERDVALPGHKCAQARRRSGYRKPDSTMLRTKNRWNSRNTRSPGKKRTTAPTAIKFQSA